MKRQDADWEEIFANDMCSKGLVTRINKEVSKLNSRKQTNKNTKMAAHWDWSCWAQKLLLVPRILGVSGPFHSWLPACWGRPHTTPPATIPCFLFAILPLQSPCFTERPGRPSLLTTPAPRSVLSAPQHPPPPWPLSQGPPPLVPVGPAHIPPLNPVPGQAVVSDKV